VKLEDKLEDEVQDKLENKLLQKAGRAQLACLVWN